MARRPQQVVRGHRVVGLPTEVGNVLRAAYERGDLVSVGEPMLYGKRVVIDVMLREPASPAPGSREEGAQRAQAVRRIVLTVGLGGVATAGGVTTAMWVVEHATTLLGAAVVIGGVAGRPLAPVVRAAVRGVVHAAIGSRSE